MTEQPDRDNHSHDDAPAERAEAEGREVYVTRDEAGVTSLAENEQAATPRPVDATGESGGAVDDQDSDDSA
jgi:hypothetical protein